MQAYRREVHSEDEDLDSDEDEEGDNETYADGEGDPCPNCGRIYKCALHRVLLRALRAAQSWAGLGSQAATQAGCMQTMPGRAALKICLCAGCPTSGSSVISATRGMTASV